VAIVATVLAAILAGCASRYDSHGMTRVGVGLWGFGDPPVNWNLDWPRREVPELPPTTYPELPPRAPPADLPARRTSAPIDDNRACVDGRDLTPPSDPSPVCGGRRAGAGARDHGSARR
jgi:hypothetical protein